jgi:glycosyltransferase involved in cell wall biosynthesis
VSVIIPVFNDIKGLDKCLSALADQTYETDLFEVVVVDNGSEEDIEKVTKKYDKAIYAFESGKGPAAARNRGIILSKGEVLAFTDSDCVPAADWIEKGVEAITEVPDRGLIAGKVELVYRDPDKIGPIELYDTVSYLLQRRYIEKYKFSATANLFTRRHVVDKVGLFNDVMFKTASGEDAEWGQRVFEAGYEQHYAEEALVTHPAPSSFADLCKKTARITRGNIIVKRLKGNNKVGTLAGDLFGSIAFLSRQIWQSGIIAGWRQKLLVSFIAAAMICVKISIRISEGFKDRIRAAKA